MENQHENSPSGIHYCGKMESIAYFWVLFFIHFVVAVYYKEVSGLILTANGSGDKLDCLWQVLPFDLLKTDLLESIWNLHSQPPLFNVYSAIFLRLFDANYVPYMHYTNIIFGSIISGMLFSIILNFTNSKRFSLIIAALLSVNSALFLYEAYILYTLQTAFLVVFSIYLLSLFQRHGNRYIYGILFVICINALVLMRSSFHILILIIAIPLICIMSGNKWRRVLTVSVLISALSVGWYTKNYCKFDFYGGSSWFGISLWKIAAYGYSGDELEDLVRSGVVNRIVAKRHAFTLPSKYIEYGFDRKSEVDALSRDDFNNINILAISKLYYENAVKLILHDPWHYLETIRTAYCIYVMPSSQYRNLIINIPKIMFHDNIYYFGLQWGGALLFLALPLSLILYFLIPVRYCGLSAIRFKDFLRSDGAMFFCAFLILYNMIVSCMVECGENNRFKFEIEQVLWAFIAGVAYRYLFRRSEFLGRPGNVTRDIPLPHSPPE